MKVVASTDDYTIYLRRDGRHAVKGADKAPINGEDKVKILLEHGLIEAPAPKEPEPEVSEEEAADGTEEGAEGGAEEGAEEAEASAEEPAEEPAGEEGEDEGKKEEGE